MDVEEHDRLRIAKEFQIGDVEAGGLDDRIISVEIEIEEAVDGGIRGDDGIGESQQTELVA